MQKVWESSTGEEDFGFASFKKREKSTGSHLLRQRRTLFYSSLLHGKWLQTGVRQGGNNKKEVKVRRRLTSRLQDYPFIRPLARTRR